MSEPSTTIVTRFAPSPTGYLHIGGARTALFNWAMARRHGGRFLLRFEDTDRARSSAEAEQSIIEDLEWLGLDWDNDPIPRQSKRRKLYHKAIKTLKDKGLAYDHADGNGAVVFRMPDHDTTFDDVVRGTVTTPAGQIEDFVIQKADGFPTFHLAVVVDDAEMGVTHVIRGTDHLTNTAKHIALQQALGLPTPTYAHMSLTVNPDGSKLGKRDKAKAARKAALENELSATNIIAWAKKQHIVELFLEDGKPFTATVQGAQDFLDKKNDDPIFFEAIADALDLTLPEINVRDFCASGYLPLALINYLGLLGWNPGNDIEDFSPKPRDFLKNNFDIKRLIKADATFDRDKLKNFNSTYLKQQNDQELALFIGEHFFNQRDQVVDTYFFTEQAKQEIRSPGMGDEGSLKDIKPMAAGNWIDTNKVIPFVHAYRERIKLPSDIVDQGAFFFANDDAIAYDFDAKNVKKVMLKGEPNGFDALEELKTHIADLPDDDDFGAAAHELIQQLAEQRGINMGKLAQPLRVAVSGGTVTPPIDATLDILGKPATLARIDRCLAQKPQ